jgi:hypothetical protein
MVLTDQTRSEIADSAPDRSGWQLSPPRCGGLPITQALAVLAAADAQFALALTRSSWPTQIAVPSRLALLGDERVAAPILLDTRRGSVRAYPEDADAASSLAGHNRGTQRSRG